MDRDPAEARFCAECKRYHSAEEGDLWAESSMLGLRITYFACMDGKVYDITGDRQILILFPVIYHSPKLVSFFFRVHFYFRHMTGCDSVMFQSGRAARGSAFLLTRTVCPTTFHLVQRTPILHDTGTVIFRFIVMVLVLLFF